MTASSIAIGPLDVAVNTVQGGIDELLAALERPHPTCVAFANTHLLYQAVRDQSLARLLRSFVVFNDGVGLSVLARIAANRGFAENLNGTDFTPALLQAAPPGTRLYLAGGEPGVAEASAVRIASLWPQLEICGACDGYAEAACGKQTVARLRPDIVLVAMGNPAQERWIWETAHCAGRGVYIGVGAFFDFLTARHRRAPSAMRRLRLEWLFRLAGEPNRLWRRYSLEILHVLAAALRQRLSGRSAP